MEVLINFVESLYFYLVLLLFRICTRIIFEINWVVLIKCLDRIQNIRIHLCYIWF